MSRKRPKNKAKVRASKSPPEVEETAGNADADADADAVVEAEVLAEGSGPHETLEAAIDEAADEIAAQYETAGDDAPGSDEAAAMAAALEAVADHANPALEVVETDLDAEASEELSAAAEGAPEDGELHAEVDTEDGSAAELPTSAASMEPGQLKLLVEALVFAADKPITVLRLRQLTRIADTKKLEATLLEIQADYEHRGLILSSVSGGWQFRTRPQFSAWVQQLIAGRPVRLSRAQLETLAIVAYRQPITRPEIDDIRGVDSSATLKLLLDRGLIRVLGKKEEVGRPMLYGTTKEFLDFFSLADLRELPTLREYSELSDESRQVITNKLGAADDDGSGSGGDGGSSGGGGAGGGGPLGDGGEGDPAADGAIATSFDTSDVPDADDAMRAWAAEADAATGEETDDATVEASAESTDEAGSSDVGDADGVYAESDALSRLAARVLAGSDEPEAPDTELAEGSGAVSADEMRADADEGEPVEATDDAPDAADTDEEDARFATGSRAFAAVTDTEAAELATVVAAHMTGDENVEPDVDESAHGSMLVATDDVVDDEAPAEPSAESE